MQIIDSMEEFKATIANRPINNADQVFVDSVVDDMQSFPYKS